MRQQLVNVEAGTSPGTSSVHPSIFWRLALASFGAGAVAGWLIPLSSLEGEGLSSARGPLGRAARQSLDGFVEAVRRALRPLSADERAARQSAEQPPHPYETLPRGFPFREVPHEYPLDETVTVRARLSTHDFDEEEPLPDLRNDVVGDEHPF